LDFGMIPIGAYLPRQIMKAMHMNPEEAVSAFLDARCRRAVAMHWGTFRLTDEPMQEPVILLGRALKRKNLPADSFAAGRVGEIWNVVPAVI
jgi:N-acyl-phosphatidylethanolamine-hydrolysing phospholipase D